MTDDQAARVLAIFSRHLYAPEQTVRPAQPDAA
jgi:hypothetical protein